MKQRRLPRYCSEFKDRHDKMHVRFRRKGQTGYYFTAAPWSAEFMVEYQSCLDKTTAPAVQPGAKRTKAGTFDHLLVSYYAAPVFTGLKSITKATYRGIYERFRKEHGSKRVAALERKHVAAIIGKLSATPSAANHLLDRLKALMTFAIDMGFRRDDPTYRLRGYKTSGEGYHTWTEDQIERFLRRHPAGSKARLALTLMLYTGQRRADAVQLGWEHVAGIKISVRQQKTDERVTIRMHADLRIVLRRLSKTSKTFIITEYGKPFTAAGFGGWFRERCDEAGLRHCTAHGLRKAAARRLAEAGCSNQQIKSITGHKTDREVARYTAAADQVKLADQAMDKFEGAQREQKLSNRAKKLDKNAANNLKRKGF
jgi:integrase